MKQLASVIVIIGVLIACVLLARFFSENFTKSEMSEKLDASHCKCSPLHSNIFKPKSKYRVVNGKIVTDPLDFPYVAAFLEKGVGEPFLFCSGSVITPSYVLTAAHCLEDLVEKRSLQDKTIVASGLNHDLKTILKSNDNVRKIKNAIMHSGYVPHGNPSPSDSDSDIGLVELDRPFEFNEKTKIAPACIYGLRDYNSSYLVQAGYGITEPHSVKKGKSLDEMPKLRMMYYTELYDYDSYLRLKSDKSATCSGDSGSGIGHVDSTNRYFLIGIVSSGGAVAKGGEFYYCMPNSEDKIVSTKYFADFILDNVKDGNNLCHTRLIITDRFKVLIYWLIVCSIIIIIGIFLFLFLDIKIEQFNFSPVLSLLHPNKPSFNSNQPLYNPNQLPFNPNQLPYNPNQLPYNLNQPLYNPNQPLFQYYPKNYPVPNQPFNHPNPNHP